MYLAFQFVVRLKGRVVPYFPGVCVCVDVVGWKGRVCVWVGGYVFLCVDVVGFKGRQVTFPDMCACVCVCVREKERAREREREREVSYV